MSFQYKSEVVGVQLCATAICNDKSQISELFYEACLTGCSDEFVLHQ
jgi:hypothetical protein